MLSVFFSCPRRRNLSSFSICRRYRRMVSLPFYAKVSMGTSIFTTKGQRKSIPAFVGHVLNSATVATVGRDDCKQTGMAFSNKTLFTRTGARPGTVPSLFTPGLGCQLHDDKDRFCFCPRPCAHSLVPG